MIEKVRKFVIENNLIKDGDRIVIGVSGGADSICLLHLLNELKKDFKLELFCVHINHMLRGAEADEDEAYVKAYCDKLGVKIYAFHRDIAAMAEEEKLSTEEAGRIFRYRCFEEVFAKENCDSIAVAHHKNDLVETMLFNLIRGSSVNGLSGIRPRRDNIIRPLLGLTRDEIETYLRNQAISYRTDATNDENDYSRNRIRNVILPELISINDGAIEHMARFADDCARIYESRCKEADSIWKSVKRTDARIDLDIMLLNDKDTDLRYELYLKAIEYICNRRKDIIETHLALIDRLIAGENSKSVDLPYGILARKNNTFITIEIPKEETVKDEYADILKEGVFRLKQGTLSVKMVASIDKNAIPKLEYTKFVDYDKIKGGLCLRTPQDEDFIVIDKNGGRKKLKRLFTDCKTDIRLRDSWPVLACGNEIIWAIGLRFSEKYKIDENTKNIYQFIYRKDKNYGED